MNHYSRRTILKAAITGAAVTSLPSVATVTKTTSSPGEIKATPRKGRIKQSVSRWCYEKIPLDELCKRGAEMGLKAIDLLEVAEWDVPRRYGLICSMGYAGGGDIP